jgi:hypothetical protein
MSKSQVSRLRADIDERVNAFLARPLEGAWPYPWLDATYLKVREGGRIVSRAVRIAVAVNDDGKREMLGVATGPSEAETFWTDFLRSLADRGLRGVKLVVADDHKGLRAAARRVFNATHQRCRIHWMRNALGMRNALAHAPTKQRMAVAAMLKTIFAQETKVDAAWQTNVKTTNRSPRIVHGQSVEVPLLGIHRAVVHSQRGDAVAGCLGEEPVQDAVPVVENNSAAMRFFWTLPVEVSGSCRSVTKRTRRGTLYPARRALHHPTISSTPISTSTLATMAAAHPRLAGRHDRSSDRRPPAGIGRPGNGATSASMR